MADISNYNLKDLFLLQTKQLGNQTVGTNASYSFPKTILTYVQVGDVGADYVAGSPGQVKTIADFTYNGSIYTLYATTTLKYKDATYPTKATEIVTV